MLLYIQVQREESAHLTGAHGHGAECSFPLGFGVCVQAVHDPHPVRGRPQHQHQLHRTHHLPLAVLCLSQEER